MSHSRSILPYVGTCFGFHLSCCKQMLSGGPFQSVCRMICFFHKLMLQSFIIKIRIVIQQLLLCFVFRLKIGQPWRYLWSSHMNLKFGLFTFKPLMRLRLEKNFKLKYFRKTPFLLCSAMGGHQGNFSTKNQLDYVLLIYY